MGLRQDLWGGGNPVCLLIIGGEQHSIFIYEAGLPQKTHPGCGRTLDSQTPLLIVPLSYITLCRPMDSVQVRLSGHWWA